MGISVYYSPRKKMAGKVVWYKSHDHGDLHWPFKVLPPIRAALISQVVAVSEKKSQLVDLMNFELKL